LQSRTKGGYFTGKVFQILGQAKTRKVLKCKLRLWHGTDRNKVAEECTNLVGAWCSNSNKNL